jgi:CRP-like cAMP-binding protein
VGKLLVTWGEIARYCGLSVRTVRRMRDEMVEQRIVFRRRRRLGKRVYCAWAADLERFFKK